MTKPKEKKGKTLRELEVDHRKRVIEETLRANGYAISKTAEVLGITRVSLWRYMRNLSITVPEVAA